MTDARPRGADETPGNRDARRRHDTRLGTWQRFLQAHAVVTRRLEAELVAEQRLSLADLDVLITLAESDDGSLRMSELADRAIVSRSGMTRRVDGLEAAGFVERRPCPSDRRGAMAVLTDQGRQRLAHALPTHLRGVEKHFLAPLSADDLAAIRRAFRKLAAPDAADVSPPRRRRLPDSVS